MTAVGLGRTGVIAFVVIVAALHVARQDLPPADHFVSEYARGWTRPIQTVAFVSWAASMAAAAVVTMRIDRARRPLARGVVVVAFTLAALGTALAAAFVSQTVAGQLPANVARTTEGRLHDLGTLGILAGLLVAATASLRLIGRVGYRLAVAALGILLLAVVPVMTTLGLDAPGLGQRAFVLIACTWQLVFLTSASGAANRRGAHSPVWHGSAGSRAL